VGRSTRWISQGSRQLPAGYPTLVAGLDDHSRRSWRTRSSAAGGSPALDRRLQFDEDELEAALTHTSVAVPDSSPTSRLAALGAHEVDVDVGDLSGRTRGAQRGVDLDVGAATGMHAANGGLDLDVGSATVPDTTFAATQRLSSEDLALPDLEPVTMSEVGTKLDLARAYMDMVILTVRATFSRKCSPRLGGAETGSAASDGVASG